MGCAVIPIWYQSNKLFLEILVYRTDFSPGYEFDIVVYNQFTALPAGKEIVIRLSPRGIPIRVTNCNCLHFVIVVSNMDEECGYSWTKVIHQISINTPPYPFHRRQ